MNLCCSIGIGCSSRATASDVIQLIQRCVGEIAPCSILATLDRCSSIGEDVAAALKLRLMLFPATVLAQVRGIKSRSPLAASKVGTASVAEASALASLGPMARLILPRQTGRFCTCAVAVLP
ncbi:cobalamin biosynthesis protein [Tunturiibacter gelidiferens]|uniref:cobalamin biosynthesis protein n=1 Tax=Tunturiibacter gelidiferens TaxID=3069689 RepID=UPI003D9B3816